MYAFVVPKDGVTDSVQDIEDGLKKLIKTQIGSFAVPQSILVSDMSEELKYLSFPQQITPGLPKTRSGKIMRRILRKIAANDYEDLGDITTLADSSVVEQILSTHKAAQK